MIDTIYIARHGYRLSWVTNTWKSVTGLPRDPPLAAFGETQAKETAAYFLSLPENERPTVIFSSPYYRCLQTAQPISQALNVPIFVEHGLSEWYSHAAEGTGLHPRPGSAKSLQAYFPEIDDTWSSVFYPPRTGEDVTEVHDRASAFLGALIPETERRFSPNRVLLVSHAATIITLIRDLAGNRDLPVRVGCCSLTKATRKADAAGVASAWNLELVADGAHLSGGASRDWGFEDIEISNGQVVNDSGIPGTEAEVGEPVGSQVHISSNL
ncbi:hypothetical protein PLICRDRAFT_673492 [Plicaturopsis crispa FD-325 SS-3]|nr:hypothetical protein PLICRDRAFT_673492 [Plicaturopsis crispa FD-325 SS-3]